MARWQSKRVNKIDFSTKILLPIDTAMISHNRHRTRRYPATKQNDVMAAISSRGHDQSVKLKEIGHFTYLRGPRIV